MALVREPLNRAIGFDGRVCAGVAALGIAGLVVAGAFVGLAGQARSGPDTLASIFDGYLLRVVRFTLWQAVLSTVLSVGLAVPVAHALYRQASFPGRNFVVQLFAVPLGLPAIVVALGVVALYGRAGLLATFFGGGWPNVYGLGGILIAHVFFNLPLATRLLLEALRGIPDDQWRLAAQLGMGPRSGFRFLEWPALRAALPGIAGLVLMLCVTSFTIVLTLGGGPRATTLEVAIYQALRFDFDPLRAALLTLVQIVMTALAVVMLGRLGAVFAADAAFSVGRGSPLPAGRRESYVNGFVICLALVFVGAPLAAVVADGLGSDLARLATEPVVQRAFATSLVLSALSAILAVTLSLALVGARRRLEWRRREMRPSLLERCLDMGPGMILVVPPVVIGAGWFILLMRTGDAFAYAPAMVVAVNALMAMPFAVRAIRPAHDAASARHEKLCSALGIVGMARLKLIDWPVLRRPTSIALAFSMALSLGDLGVIALFGSDGVQTLPYLLLSRMSSYRTADAAGLALILGLLCFGLMMLADRLGRRAP